MRWLARVIGGGLLGSGLEQTISKQMENKTKNRGEKLKKEENLDKN